MILWVLIGCVSGPGRETAAAQTADNRMSITATAVVVGDIELETVRNVEFRRDGISEPVIYIDPSGDVEAGQLKAYGTAGAAFRVTFINDLDLIHHETDEPLRVQYEVAGFPEDEQEASQPLDALEHELRFNEEGVYYFWIGGRVETEAIRSGEYTGEFTLEMEYH